MKNLIALCLTLALTVAMAGAEGSKEAKVKELKLGYAMSPGGPAHEAAQLFADLVAKKTNGKLTVKLFPSGQLGNEREMAEGIQMGSLDLTLMGSAPISWYTPQFGVIEAPFIFRDYEHMDKVVKGPIGKEIEAALNKAKGFAILDWWHRGPRFLTTTSRVIKSPDDLKGLKLRVPEVPVYLEGWKLLGANVTPITYTEMFMALKSGVVEGQENPLETIFTASLFDVQKNVMETKHLLGCYFIFTSDKLLAGLPQNQQTALREAAVEAGKFEHDQMVKYDEDFATKLKQKGMVFHSVNGPAFREVLVNQLPKKFEDKWAPGIYQRIVDTK